MLPPLAAAVAATLAVFEIRLPNISSRSRVASSLSFSRFCIIDALGAYKRALNGSGGGGGGDDDPTRRRRYSKNEEDDDQRVSQLEPRLQQHTNGRTFMLLWCGRAAERTRRTRYAAVNERAIRRASVDKILTTVRRKRSDDDDDEWARTSRR